MRQHQAVISSLRAGDEVVTAGGLYGTIASIDEDVLSLDVAPGVVLRVLRSAVSSRIGSLDEDDTTSTEPIADPATAEDDS
jgi:preprotein translocase subunit YajC